MIAVSGKQFVGAFPGEHDLDAALVDRAAEQELRHAICIHERCFGIPHRIGIGRGEVLPSDDNGIVVRAGKGCLFLRDRCLIVEFIVKGERGKEHFEIGMADKAWTIIGDSLKAGGINKYIPDGLTKEWQEG